MGKISMLVALLCAIWVIYDVWEKQKEMDNLKKLLWTASAVIFSVLTAIAYYLVVKRKAIKF
ncbi:MAG: PLDc N-terminal domain-containing protein [Breznakibacter sp.]